jgi:hypothetical protein
MLFGIAEGGETVPRRRLAGVATEGRTLSQANRVTENEGGRVTAVTVAVTAAETLADGEFNVFYVRGVCRRAIHQGIRAVEVYRGRAVMDPRPESQAKVGLLVLAEDLLNDLRVSKGVDSALKIPAGPNSGLTVRLPLRAAS